MYTEATPVAHAYPTLDTELMVFLPESKNGIDGTNSGTNL